MGIINPDEYINSNGIKKANTYISFNNETLYLVKNPVVQNQVSPSVDATSDAESSAPVVTYRLSANYRIFWDKAAKDAGRSFIELRHVSTVIPETDLTANLYEKLYHVLKDTTFPNAFDEI
jgi:hypothetical protein